MFKFEIFIHHQDLGEDRELRFPGHLIYKYKRDDINNVLWPHWNAYSKMGYHRKVANREIIWGVFHTALFI